MESSEIDIKIYSENDKFGEFKIQRFFCCRWLKRKQELRNLQSMAKSKSIIQTNRFIALSIAETVLHNWWLRHHDAVYLFMEDPKTSPQRRIYEEDELLATGCMLYETKFKLIDELQKLIEKHHYQLMVRKLFDPYEPYITQQFLFENNIIKRF
jgi:hypothetical protein